jgi:hypothetical protein
MTVAMDLVVRDRGGGGRVMLRVSRGEESNGNLCIFVSHFVDEDRMTSIEDCEKGEERDGDEDCWRDIDTKGVEM